MFGIILKSFEAVNWQAGVRIKWRWTGLQVCWIIQYPLPIVKDCKMLRRHIVSLRGVWHQIALRGVWHPTPMRSSMEPLTRSVQYGTQRETSDGIMLRLASQSHILVRGPPKGSCNQRIWCFCKCYQTGGFGLYRQLDIGYLILGRELQQTQCKAFEASDSHTARLKQTPGIFA